MGSTLMEPGYNNNNNIIKSYTYIATTRGKESQGFTHGPPQRLPQGTHSGVSLRGLLMELTQGAHSWASSLRSSLRGLIQGLIEGKRKTKKFFFETLNKRK